MNGRRTIGRERDPVPGEHPLDHRRRAGQGAVDDDDLVRRDAAPKLLDHLGGDELGLRTIPGRLEQADAVARIDALRRRLEQEPLEEVERGARHRLVVLVERRQLADSVRERAKLLDDLGARAERGPAGLVGERDGHVDADDPAQRLDRVALDRGQVVEAVHEHRLRAPQPGSPRRASSARHAYSSASTRPDPVELAAVAVVDARDVLRIADAPRIGGRPRRQRLIEKRCGVTSERCSSAISSPAAPTKPGACADRPSTPKSRSSMTRRSTSSRWSAESRRAS